MKRLLAAALFCAATSASAHDFWLAPAAFQMDAPGVTRVDFSIGHASKVEPWNLQWSRVYSLRTYTAEGVADHQRSIIPKTPLAPGFARVALEAAGTHVVAFESRDSFSELEAERFNAYAEKEGLVAVLSARENAGTTDESGRETYSRRAKALVQVGDVVTDNVLEPIGQTLEIVPLRHPYALGDDRALPVRVLFRGEPLQGALIDLTDLASGDGPLQSRRTDAAGVATFEVPEAGAFKLNVIWGVSTPASDRAEFDTIFCSLTFGMRP
ncbi:MAG: DUF4198 domain-containing protein [Pseudomonadota bacterium]